MLLEVDRYRSLVDDLDVIDCRRKLAAGRRIRLRQHAPIEIPFDRVGIEIGAVVKFHVGSQMQQYALFSVLVFPARGKRRLQREIRPNVDQIVEHQEQDLPLRQGDRIDRVERLGIVEKADIERAAPDRIGGFHGAARNAQEKHQTHQKSADSLCQSRLLTWVQDLKK